MSKNFGVIGVVASFVFACSFLAAIPVQADFVFQPREGKWDDVAQVEFSVRSDGRDGWEANGWSEGVYFDGTPTGTPGFRGDAINYIHALAGQLSPTTRVAVRIEVEGNGNGIGALLDNLDIVGFGGSGTEDSPIYSPQTGGEEGNGGGYEAAAVGEDEAYFYDLETFLVDENLEFTIPQNVLNENGYVKYIVTFQVQASDSGVPEPATFALFGLGLLGTGLVASRRRNKK